MKSRFSIALLLLAGVVMSGDDGRSSHWPKTRDGHLRHNPVCQWLTCHIQVHHVIPVHWAREAGHPWLELCPENLITLCPKDHLEFAHVGNFKRFNLDIRNDAAVGKFNSRGLSEWPGEDEMREFLKWSLGPPSEVPPETLPLVVTNPAKAWKKWQERDCEGL